MSLADENSIKVKSIPFKELIKIFEKRTFAIPDIQRNFVWTKKKIINLLDSINKHYPIGSFLICKVPSRQHKNIKESSVLPRFESKNNKFCYIIIDGQQRLSVLYSILFGKKIRSHRYKSDINPKLICLTKKRNKESEFEFYKDINHKYLSLYEILGDRLKYEDSKNKLKRIKNCKKSFDNYSLPFIFINGYDEKRMKEAFIRLNQGGTKLSTVDQIFALAYHKNVDLRRHCEQFVRHDLKKVLRI